MTATADPVDAVAQLLIADAAVQAIAGDNVFSGELPAELNAQMPTAAIVLNPSGGPGRRSYQQFGAKRIDVICYGPTVGQSWLLYLAAEGLLEAIERIVSQGVLLHSATCSSRGATAKDPVKEWPTTYSSWLVTASYAAAA